MDNPPAIDESSDRWRIETPTEWGHNQARIDYARERVREQTPVIWIRYNPVLEISIAAGIATATAIIALWKRHSLARVEASKADIPESEARVAIEMADTVIARQKLDQDLIVVPRLS